MSTLDLRFEPEDEWHGELFTTISSKGFAGQASAWFTTEDLRAFARVLSAFPLDRDAPPSLVGGIGFVGSGPPDQVHLSIQVEPFDALGWLRVTAVLATVRDDRDRTDLGCSTMVRFLTAYGEIGSFATAISALVDGKIDKASLRTTVGPG